MYRLYKSMGPYVIYISIDVVFLSFEHVPWNNPSPV